MKAYGQRIAAMLVPAFLASVVIVGAAQATASAPPDWFERAAARGAAGSVIPNDRGGMQGVGGIVAAQQPAPDWFERAANRNAAPLVNPDDRGGVGPGSIGLATSSSVSVASDGFAWADAAFGAAGALGVVVVGALAALTIRHRKRLIMH